MKTYRISLLTLLLLLTTWAVANDSTRKTQENDIREAVFRHQFAHNASGQKQAAKVYFLSVNRADPSDTLMARFENHQPPVKKASQSETSPSKGVVDKKTGARGLIFNTAQITWKSDTLVLVEGGYYEANLSASGNIYTVEKKHGKWLVTKDQMQWIS